jgi:membrane glycosyltransferase
MAVLDADSVMSGDCLVSLVRLMEAHPRAGIVQTAPRSCGHDTLHARAQSFLSRVTGPMFTRGLAYWQLGESHYWGHNAILRVEPFMRHCGLAPLPGRGGLSGEILSHDFVEAALMRRAGYEVWLAPDLDGSFEQPPTQLLDELQRDRRWCQGNLQNARLAAEPGLRGVHRAMFITGALSYLASPLWLAFVIVSAWHAAHGHATAVGSMVVSHPLLWAMVLAMLFLPRVLGVLHVMAQRQQHLFGGTAGLWGGAALEALLSALQAPVRMAAHTLFVLVALTGLKLDWKSPSRASAVLRWSEAAAGLRWLMLPLLLAAAVVAASGNSGLAMSLAPMLLPLLLSLPLAVVGSQRVVGRALRRQGLLTIPEEAAPPPVLRHAWRQVKTLRVHERQQERARQQHLPAGGALPAPALPALAFAGLAEAAQRQAAGAGAHGLRANGLRAHGLRANGLRALVAGAAVAMLALFTPTPPGTATLHGPDMEAELWRHIQLERFAKLQAESLQPVMQKASLSSKRKGVRRAAMTPATLPAAEPAAAAVTKL